MAYDHVAAEKGTSVETAAVYGSEEPAVAIRFFHSKSSSAVLGLRLEDALTLAVQLIEAVRSTSSEFPDFDTVEAAGHDGTLRTERGSGPEGQFTRDDLKS